MWVNKVPRLEDDLRDLMEMTIHEDPPRVPIRPTNSKATYVVGDASGCGFGSSSYKSGETNVEATHGSRKAEVSNRYSSNFRDAAKLVMRLKQMIEKGSLERSSEVVAFTENSSAEKTMYRGSSKSKLLHNMASDLRKIEMIGYIIVHFVSISGDRMI